MLKTERNKTKTKQNKNKTKQKQKQVVGGCFQQPRGGRTKEGPSEMEDRPAAGEIGISRAAKESAG